MNRDEAAREAARLAEQNPGRRWLPSEPDDPRTSYDRNVGGPYGF